MASSPPAGVKHFVKPGARESECGLLFNPDDASHHRFVARTSDEVSCSNCRALLELGDLKTSDRQIKDATPDPEAWPACSVCSGSYVLRRAMVADGWTWAWMRDCKCRGSVAMLQRRSDYISSSR